MTKNLSKLTEVDLRQIWSTEPDFTNWLAKQENLDSLGEEVGVGIKLIKTEAEVGQFRVDILAEEENSGRKIVIENQLEETNHDHLGKIITYASGYGAEIIIWIVREAREQHQRAIEWLNEHTDGQTAYFLIKIELWQIGDSSPAPKFDILIGPNEWAKTIKAGSGDGNLSDTKLQQLDFWTKFRDFVKSKQPAISLQKPWAWNWYPIRIGYTGAHVALSINSLRNTLACELVIEAGNKHLFDLMFDQKIEFERALGEAAMWREGGATSSIKIKKEVSGSVFDQSEIENYFTWLYEKAMLFRKIFGKRPREIGEAR